MKTRNNSEIPMVPKAHLKNVEHQRNQYKAERDTLIDDLKVLREKNEELEENNEQLNEIFNYQEKKKHEYREKNEKLEATNENLTNRVRKLNLTAQIEHDELMDCDGEVRYWKQLYTTLTDHIRLKASANPGVDRYIALVNFIDRLEKGEN